MTYDDQIKLEIYKWQQDLLKEPTKIEKLSKQVQKKVNGLYPEVFHKTVTHAMREMVKTVLLGSQYTTATPKIRMTLKDRDELARKAIDHYKAVAVVEGAGTGSGGIVMGMCDFPLLLSIKIKLLYEIAAIYGFDTSNFKERIYILSIFELAFSGQEHVREVYGRMNQWDHYKKTIPEDIEAFDWRTFQQEYRDYLDIAKLMQMLPIIGAPVGAYVNHKLIKKLGYMAIQAYRLRWVIYR